MKKKSTRWYFCVPDEFDQLARELSEHMGIKRSAVLVFALKRLYTEEKKSGRLVAKLVKRPSKRRPTKRSKTRRKS